jgi:hypothetical protein
MDISSSNPIDAFLKESDLFFYGNNFWQAGVYQQIEGLTLEQALWRPASDKHCIWQIVRHMNYWKRWAFKYLKEGIKENAKDFNWAALPEVQNEENWKKDREDVKTLHEEFKTICSGLGIKLFVSGEENIVFFRTVLFHDSYHSGQIGLIRSLQGIKAAV